MGIRDRLAGKASAPTGGDFPDIVKFEEPGDEVAGIVTAVREATTDYGDADVIEIDDEVRGEPISVFATSYGLKAGLIEGENELGREVRPGDEVYVRYEGKSQTKKGNTVNNFAIAVAEGEGSTDADDDDSDDLPF